MAHPEHGIVDRYRAPLQPLRWGFFKQWLREWSCETAGGHWWHPSEYRVIGWFCCQCGAETKNPIRSLSER